MTSEPIRISHDLAHILQEIRFTVAALVAQGGHADEVKALVDCMVAAVRVSANTRILFPANEAEERE